MVAAQHRARSTPIPLPPLPPLFTLRYSLVEHQVMSKVRFQASHGEGLLQTSPFTVGSQVKIRPARGRSSVSLSTNIGAMKGAHARAHTHTQLRHAAYHPLESMVLSNVPHAEPVNTNAHTDTLPRGLSRVSSHPDTHPRHPKATLVSLFTATGVRPGGGVPL